MLHKCELRGSSSALSFRRLEKLVKMKLLSGMSEKNSEADKEIVVGQVDDEEMDLDDEPDLNLKLSDEDEVVEDDDGDDTDIDDDLLNSFTSVLTTPESPVKRLVIDSDVESDMNDTSLVIDTDDDDDNYDGDDIINSDNSEEETVIEEFKCHLCSSQFMTEKSLKIHRSQCAKSQKTREIKFKTSHTAGPAAAVPVPVSEHNSSNTTASSTSSNAVATSSTTGEIIPSQSFVFPSSNRKKKKTQKCNVCGKLFSQKGSLTRHFETIHKNFQMKKCNLCDENFFKLVELKRHKHQIHGIEYPSAVSTKLNNSPNIKSVTANLDGNNQHSNRIHCDVCDRTFSCVGNLKAHMANVHDANKVHKCDFCDKSFHQSVQLIDHIKQNHGGPKKYKCDYCEKTFDRIGHRNIHVNGVHKKLRDFKCEFCSKTFTTSCNMMKHIRIVHYALKNYNCDFCEKKFSQSSHLKSHLNNVHKGMKIFKCKYCEKSFSRSDHLKSHTISAHQSIKYELSSSAASSEFDPILSINDQSVLPVLNQNNPLPVPVPADPISSSSAPGSIPILAAITTSSSVSSANIQNNSTPVFVRQELEEYKCDICNIVFITSTHLNDHNKSVHEEQNPIQTDLDSDDSVLQIKSDVDDDDGLNEIVPIEEEKNLESHQPKERIILKMKKYNCELCDKSFVVSKDLRRHINSVHEGLKPYTCSFCQNQFSRSDHLKRHISLTHIISGGSQKKLQITNVTSLAATESGTKLIEKLKETTNNSSAVDSLWIRDYKKVMNVSEKDDESLDNKTEMTNISEESRPPKRINTATATSTPLISSMPPTSSLSLETSKLAAASTPTSTPYVALQITDVIPMKHVQNDQYVLALKWTKMPNSSSASSTSTSSPNNIASPIVPVENKPELLQAQNSTSSMPIVSEIDKNVIPTTENPKTASAAAHLMVNSTTTTHEKIVEQPEQKQEQHRSTILVPRGSPIKTVAEKPEGPDGWAGYAPVNTLPKLAPKPKHGTSASSMYRHLSRLGGNERTCDVCNKTFSDRSYLKVHIKSVHYGTKEHQCKQCDKKFLKQSHLRKHVAGIHEGIKHKCEFCNKIFSASNGRHSLLRHISSVHQGIKFQCNHCERQFNRTDHLKAHMMKSHQCHLDKNNVTIIKAVTTVDSGTSETSVTYVTETTTIRHYASSASKYTNNTVPSSSEYMRSSSNSTSTPTGSRNLVLAPKLPLPLPPTLTPSRSSSVSTSLVPKGTTSKMVPIRPKPPPTISSSISTSMPSAASKITKSSIASIPVILQPKNPQEISDNNTSIITSCSLKQKNNPVASNNIITNNSTTSQAIVPSTTITATDDLLPFISTIPNGVASKRITSISTPDQEMGSNGKLKSLLVDMQTSMGSANEMRQIASITSQADKYLKKSETNDDDIIKEKGDRKNKNDHHKKQDKEEDEQTKKVEKCNLCKDVFGSDRHEFDGCFIP